MLGLEDLFIQKVVSSTLQVISNLKLESDGIKTSQGNDKI